MTKTIYTRNHDRVELHETDDKVRFSYWGDGFTRKAWKDGEGEIWVRMFGQFNELTRIQLPSGKVRYVLNTKGDHGYEL